MISDKEKKLVDALGNGDKVKLILSLLDYVQETSNKLAATFPVSGATAPAIVTAMKIFIASIDHNFPGAEALGNSFYELIKEHITEVKIDLGGIADDNEEVND